MGQYKHEAPASEWGTVRFTRWRFVLVFLVIGAKVALSN